MTKTKRGGDDRTRRSHKSRQACNILERVQKSKRVVHDLVRTPHKSRRIRNGEEEVTESLASGCKKVQNIKSAVNDLPVKLHRSRRARNAKEEITNSFASGPNVNLLWDLASMAYPKPPITTPDDDMILVNTFEETFGDTYPEGDWREFSKKASSNIDRYVVALASFSGELQREKALCMLGFFIEWNGSTVILTSANLVRSSSDKNKIDRFLRIEVLLPKKRRIQGMLQHYSLHYNVALVSVKDCRVVRPAIIQRSQCVCSEVVAVGRCFNSGALMATIGDAVSWTGTLDCYFIARFSCKITKAGIGGPLVNLDGEVVGINFYDTRIGTPFLEWKVVECILEHFCEKSKAGEVWNESDPYGAVFWKMSGVPSNKLNSNAGEVGSDSDSCGMPFMRRDGDPSDRLNSTTGEVGSGSDPCDAAFWKIDGDPSDRLNRWPVPVPCWRRRDDVDKDKKCEDDEMDLEPPPPSDSYAYELYFPFDLELGSEPPPSRRSNKCRRNPYRYGFIDGEKVLLYL